MVEVLAAGSGEHTTRVELESRLIGLNGDRDGARLDHVGQVGFIASGIVGVRFDRGDRGAGLASTIDTLVRIRGFRADAVGNDVLKGIIHQPTIASLVTIRGGAIHELLLREGHQGASGDLVSTFHGASGGESPAGPALTLVLDGGDGSLGAPVERGGNIGDGFGGAEVLGSDVFADTGF